MGGLARKEHQGCEGDEMSAVATMPAVRGKLTANAPLAPLVWFKSGGNAEWLFEPKDEEDLVSFRRGRWSSKPYFEVRRETRKPLVRKWTRSPAHGRNPSHSGAAPAARPSRIPKVTRPGR